MTMQGNDALAAFLEAKLATEVGPHEAREATESGKAILLDVRSLESHNKGCIPGSLHIPRAELEHRLAEIPKNKTVVAYCSDLGCQASLKATILLRKAGLDARHLVGGFQFWKDKGYPVQGPRVTPPVSSSN